jgi:hypothetical protein
VPTQDGVAPRDLGVVDFEVRVLPPNHQIALELNRLAGERPARYPESRHAITLPNGGG